MGKRKLAKITEAHIMPNILEHPKQNKGKWKEHFGNENPIVLELACGKGHYTLGLGKKYPNLNVIGIDIKGPRLWQGGKDALEADLKNVRFARLFIDHIEEYFDKEEVSEIWITFPDPQPKKEKRRLTHPLFLKKYKEILIPNGKLHLKTDNTPFFEFTIGVLTALDIKINDITRNLYHSELYKDDILQIKTHYENLFVAEGSTIKYCNFVLANL